LEGSIKWANIQTIKRKQLLNVIGVITALAAKGINVNGIKNGLKKL
jgi:hypothetical protein